MQRPELDGPYYPRISRRQLALSLAVNLMGLAAIGVLLAVAVIGAAGAFDAPPVQLACINCAGGVR